MEDKILKNQLELLLKQPTYLVAFFDNEGLVYILGNTAIDMLGYDLNTKDVKIQEIFHNIPISFPITDENQYDMPTVLETVAYRKNQTCFPVELTIMLHPEAENFIGICIAKDISVNNEFIRRYERSRQKAETAIRLQNEFVANITHELKTPMNGILGLLSQLSKTELDNNQRDIIDIIERSGNNMMKIINNLLDFSKLEAGRFSLDESAFSVRELIYKNLLLHKKQLDDKELKLTIDIARDIPDLVLGDELRLAQILNNLFSNAIKFTLIGEIIVEVVKTKEDEENVELFFVISDSGIGIEQEDMGKLFKSFTQVDSSITRRFGGSGLGLAICKELIKKMDGTIYVESQKGKGSTFSFSIRLKKYKDETSLNKVIEPVNYNQSLHEIEPKQWSEDLENKDKQRLQQTLNKVLLSLDLSSWEKAENYNNVLQNLIPSEQCELKKMAFRLELAIRKEDYELSLKLGAELSDMMKEVL